MNRYVKLTGPVCLAIALWTINTAHRHRQFDDTDYLLHPPMTSARCRAYRTPDAPIEKRRLCGIGVFINSDDAAQLATLPSIGPTRADKLIEYRQKNGPFHSLAELKHVNGIGPATVRKIAPFIEDLPSSTR